MRRKKLNALLEVLSPASPLTILIHNNPDPDAIASAVALRHLLNKKLHIDCPIYYQGIIGRSENKALVRYLNFPLRLLTNLEMLAQTKVALVDTQSGAGNNALPPQINPTIVIDHHPLLEATGLAAYSDVRPEVGATASIIMEYYRGARLRPPAPLATALFYGIKTDTMGLGRGTSEIDTKAICALLPLLDVEAISKIERAQVPPAYFKSFTEALQKAHLYDGVVISYLGPMNYPDLAAEIADFLLRIKGSRWVICMGVYKDRLILSVRTHYRRGAGQLAQQIVRGEGLAGGHGSMAGGYILLNNEAPEQLEQLCRERILAHFNIGPDVSGAPLI